MDYKKLIAGALAFSILAAATGCSDKSESSSSDSSPESVSQNADDKSKAEAETEPETEPPTPAPPVEASDANAVTFDDDDISFAEVVADDDAAAIGELSIAEVQGNKMLKFTDGSDVSLEERVQKVKINTAALIGTENLDKVHSIEMDVYADATADLLVTEDGSNVKAPGWIGGGGGTVTADDDTWYNFNEFGGEEYYYDMSGPIHVQFKFLLAAGGQKWSTEMTDANFLVMRWGMQNESDFYIDNIVFYDEEGNSIPLAK